MNRRIRTKQIFVGGVAIAIYSLWRSIWNEYKEVIESRAKYRTYFRILNKWMKLKEKKETLELYFVENHFRTIAIYGMGALGKHLAEELKNSDVVKVLYGIDKAADESESSFHILKGEENLPDVDAVIVTVVLEFDDIREKLSTKMNCPIISLEEIFN